jgi:hypothetical protein
VLNRLRLREVILQWMSLYIQRFTKGFPKRQVCI